MRVDGFWAGATRFGRGIDLGGLAERAGGWEALRAGGAALWVALGVDRDRAERWERCPPEDTAYRAVPLDHPDYPPRLREAGGPPVLYVDGDVGALFGPCVAIVGTRACTGYGTAVATHLAGELARRGVTVVSGLARGIDGWAHQATLGCGRTVAVVAHGLDHTAPGSHKWLRRRIVESGGAIVSGWPDDVFPEPHRFLTRNAWISGACTAVVVVEAPARSGALRTAACAAEQGRDVYAVPGPIGAAASRGCLDLIEGGASVVADVAETVAALTGAPLARREGWLERVFAGDDLAEVARGLGRSVIEVLGDLAALEARGEVVRLPGRRYAPGRSPQ